MNPQAANPVGRPPMTDQERQIQIIHGVMESCPFKFATSGVIGKSGMTLQIKVNSTINLNHIDRTCRFWFGCSIWSVHVIL
jgi:hypothetical protein